MEKAKKLLCTLLTAVAVITMNACHRNKYIDYSEFNRRLKSENAIFEFEEKELFFRDGVYYSYISLLNPDDTLLTMKEDGGHMLQRITVTAAAEGNTPEYLSVFSGFCSSAIRSLLPEEDTGEIMKLFEEYSGVLYTECSRSEISGDYTLSLFSDNIGVCIILERNV